MKDFSTFITREKVVFTHNVSPEDDAPAGGDGDTVLVAKKPAIAKPEDVVIRSNRISLRLENDDGVEVIVVRAQTTALALTLASKIMYSFHRTGLFLRRETPYDWNGIWDSALSDFEKTYNPEAWACIYIRGKVVFRTITVPYMDIIEKVAVLDPENYDAALEKAAVAMRQVGIDVSVDPELSVAGIFNDNRADRNLRCGIIQRTKGRNMTFNFIMNGSESHRRIEQGLLAAGHFFEAINLRRIVHSLQSKMRAGEVLQVSTEGRKLRHTAARMNMLAKMILAFEENFDVRYRPEKPDLFASDN